MNDLGLQSNEMGAINITHTGAPATSVTGEQPSLKSGSDGGWSGLIAMLGLRSADAASLPAVPSATAPTASSLPPGLSQQRLSSPLRSLSRSADSENAEPVTAHGVSTKGTVRAQHAGNTPPLPLSSGSTGQTNEAAEGMAAAASGSGPTPVVGRADSDSGNATDSLTKLINSGSESVVTESALIPSAVASPGVPAVPSTIKFASLALSGRVGTSAAGHSAVSSPTSTVSDAKKVTAKPAPGAESDSLPADASAAQVTLAVATGLTGGTPASPVVSLPTASQGLLRSVHTATNHAASISSPRFTATSNGSETGLSTPVADASTLPPAVPLNGNDGTEPDVLSHLLTAVKANAPSGEIAQGSLASKSSPSAGKSVGAPEAAAASVEQPKSSPAGVQSIESTADSALPLTQDRGISVIAHVQESHDVLGYGGPVAPVVLVHAAAATQSASPSHAPGPDVRDQLVSSTALTTGSYNTVEPAMLVTTSNVLEVGVSAGSHGWLKVRAEIDGAGGVSATVLTPSASAAETLHKEMPALSAYLASEAVGLKSLVVHQTEPSLQSGLGAQQGDGATDLARDAGTAGGSPRDAPRSGSGSVNPAPAADARAEAASISSFGSGDALQLSTLYARGEGSWLSVRA